MPEARPLHGHHGGGDWDEDDSSSQGSREEVIEDLSENSNPNLRMNKRNRGASAATFASRGGKQQCDASRPFQHGTAGSDVGGRAQRQGEIEALVERVRDLERLLHQSGSSTRRYSFDTDAASAEVRLNGVQEVTLGTYVKETIFQRVKIIGKNFFKMHPSFVTDALEYLGISDKTEMAKKASMCSG